MIIKQNDEMVICCPVCEYDYVHHDNVIVYERENGQEDAPSHKFDVYEKTSQPTNQNPSRRRDAVQIPFLGECGHYFLMNIIQHKGQTIVEFDY